MTTPRSISQAKFEETLRNHPPNHDDILGGYALVNVLPPEEFEKAHIPRSMNVPIGDLDQLEERFAKSKPIIVYCASSDCDRSPKAARKLAKMGFENVFDFEMGLEGWKNAGHAVVIGSPSRS